KMAQKRGGDRRRLALAAADDVAAAPPEDLLALDEALEQLARLDAAASQLVKLRYFAGLSVEDAAAALNLALATAYRHWTLARAWLHAHMAGREGDPAG